jgi:5-methylcytosine-specific restriction endonuclease McrA
MQNGLHPLTRSVLVLNQSYEPIHVCSARRAIVLVYRGRAEIVEALDLTIHTVSKKFPVPSVVRLGLYVRVPPKPMTLSKRNVLKRDGFQCQYCGTRSGPMTVDHVVPRTRGGRDTWENMVCACLKCNNRKGDRTPEQAGTKLLRRPRLPNHVTFIKHFVGVPDRRWRPYLFMD